MTTTTTAIPDSIARQAPAMAAIDVYTFDNDKAGTGYARSRRLSITHQNWVRPPLLT